MTTTDKAHNDDSFQEYNRSKSILQELRVQEKKNRKELILKSASKLFQKKSFYNITMRNIADSVGVSPASLYRFFENRDDLFADILASELLKMKNVLLSLTAQKTITIEELSRFLIDYMVDNETAFRTCCHFLIEANIDLKILNKVLGILWTSRGILQDILENINDTTNSVLPTLSFLATITGVIILFSNYPGITKEEKKKMMYQVALKIISDQEIFPEGEVELMVN